MAIDYLPLLIVLIVAALFAAIALVVPALLGPHRANKQKLEPYESGIIPFSDARRRFPVKFYLVAMLFILFDIGSSSLPRPASARCVTTTRYGSHWPDGLLPVRADRRLFLDGKGHRLEITARCRLCVDSFGG